MLCVFGDAISFAPSIYQYLLSLKKFPLNFWSAFLLENLTKDICQTTGSICHITDHICQTTGTMVAFATIPRNAGHTCLSKSPNMSNII